MKRGRHLRALLLLALFGLALPALRADTLTFANGDQLTGTLVRADAKVCVFHSDQAGTVTVPWANVQDLRTTSAYVVVALDGTVSRGDIVGDGHMLEFNLPTAPAPTFIAPAALRMIVDPKTYTDAVTAHPPLWRSWHGQFSGGFSQVSSTQNSVSFTGGADLQRPVPSLSWLEQRSNTIFHFQGAYGRLSQATEPTVKTSIFTAKLEQDQDLDPRLFVFASAELDHNFAQGLALQQAYGGGLGWKIMNSAKTQLSLRADLHWTHQRFLSQVNDSFLASSFTESLRQNYGRVIWTQNLSLTPSYTNGLAYQMSGFSAWAMPVYKSLSLNFTVVDSYINNPQPGFLRNSLQYSTGIQYTLP